MANALRSKAAREWRANGRMVMAFLQWQVIRSAALGGELCFRRAATSGGTKAETSPPMPAIWRTNVAVIGRTGGEAGRKTVCMSGAMAPFMPAICIS